MSFDWNDLRYFLSVARTGRLTEAARRMGTDHATVSRHVTNLEGRLGAELFRRSPRGYSLTDAGEKLLVRAETMESSAASIENDIAGEKFALGGMVRIGAPEGFGSVFLAPRLGNLTLLHPQLDLQIVAMPRVFNLTKREADIAIGLERPEKGRLYSRKLTDYTLHLYAGRRYLEQNGPIQRRQDIASHPLIGYIPELIFSPQLDYLGQIDDRVVPRLSSTSLFAQLHAVKAGAGLCILPDFMAAEDPNIVPVLTHEIELLRTFWIIAHLDARESSRIQTVINFVAEEVSACRSTFLRKRLF
ncbi:LysR family transcriptional regulator [Martelella soudanensis]|uniref:LysR family transcriptional regulator n=1 Tax=unclassified Martelella TaxID=2629616 RepID=UPI001FEF7F2E|nr:MULTISPECIES: LysR family transcriptional regulator [unclassified Martelella]